MKSKENRISSELDLGASSIFTTQGTASVLEEPETELNLFPDLILDDSNGSLTILIKHNYFSSDNDHGRELLSAFIDILLDEFSKISRIFLIDSGVLLMDPNDPLYKRFSQIIDLKIPVTCCRESIDRYSIDFTKDTNLNILSMHDIALEILNTPHLITLD